MTKGYLTFLFSECFVHIMKKYIYLFLVFVFDETKIFNKHWLVENMDSHLKKYELDRKELESSLKFQSRHFRSAWTHVAWKSRYIPEAVLGYGISWAWKSDLGWNHNGGSRLEGCVHLLPPGLEHLSLWRRDIQIC